MQAFFLIKNIHFMCFYDTIPSLTLTKGAVLLMKNQKRTLISCAMLEDEVNHILEKTHLTLPVIWIDRGLHNRPENLNQLLCRNILTSCKNQDEILLTFGLCGNGTAGLVSPNTMLRLPKFDDCINMLACRQPRTERKTNTERCPLSDPGLDSGSRRNFTTI